MQELVTGGLAQLPAVLGLLVALPLVALVVVWRKYEKAADAVVATTRETVEVVKNVTAAQIKLAETVSALTDAVKNDTTAQHKLADLIAALTDAVRRGDH